MACGHEPTCLVSEFPSEFASKLPSEFASENFPENFPKSFSIENTVETLFGKFSGKFSEANSEENSEANSEAKFYNLFLPDVCVCKRVRVCTCVFWPVSCSHFKKRLVVFVQKRLRTFLGD